MNREKKVMEVLKALGIHTESDLRAAIKKTTVNISTMAAGHTEPESVVG